LPTPVGPRKMKLPTGRVAALSPARQRRMAREGAEIARSWLITRRWSSSSIRRSLALSSSLIEVIGTPVHLATTSSISCLVPMPRRALDVLGRGRPLHLLDGDANGLVDLAELLAVPRLAQLGAGAGLVDQIDGL